LYLMIFLPIFAGCDEDKAGILAGCLVNATKTYPNVPNEYDPNKLELITLCMKSRGYVYDLSPKECGKASRDGWNFPMQHEVSCYRR